MIDKQTLEGNWSEIRGKLRSRWGELTDSELCELDGNVQEIVGHIQHKTGAAREQIESYLDELTQQSTSFVSEAAERLQQGACDTAESAEQLAKQASESLKAGYENTEQLVRQRPVESLAVCFATGLITGVIVGLVLKSK